MLSKSVGAGGASLLHALSLLGLVSGCLAGEVLPRASFSRWPTRYPSSAWPFGLPSLQTEKSGAGTSLHLLSDRQCAQDPRSLMSVTRDASFRAHFGVCE